MALIRAFPDGRLEFGGQSYRCALGRGGVRSDKVEGDGATPVGRYPLRRLLYRPDRLARPDCRLPVGELEPDDGWCDDPADPAYNKAVKFPYAASAECLWREDHLYDLIVVLGHNDDPVVPGRGSAIFMHIAAPGYGATEGCVALSQDDLLSILQNLDRDSEVLIELKA